MTRRVIIMHTNTFFIALSSLFDDTAGPSRRASSEHNLRQLISIMEGVTWSNVLLDSIAWLASPYYVNRSWCITSATTQKPSDTKTPTGLICNLMMNQFADEAMPAAANLKEGRNIYVYIYIYIYIYYTGSELTLSLLSVTKAIADNRGATSWMDHQPTVGYN